MTAAHFAPQNTALKAVPPAVLLPYQQRWLADTGPLQIREKARCTGISQARRESLRTQE